MRVAEDLQHNNVLERLHKDIVAVAPLSVAHFVPGRHIASDDDLCCLIAGREKLGFKPEKLASGIVPSFEQTWVPVKTSHGVEWDEPDFVKKHSDLGRWSYATVYLL